MSDPFVINNWSIVTGLDFRKTFLLRDPTLPKIVNPDFDSTMPIEAGNEQNVFPPKDLLNYTGRMDIRVTSSKTSTLIHTIASGGAGMTFNDPATGFVTLFIDNTITKAVLPGIGDFIGTMGNFDLFLTPPGAGVDNIQLFKGKIAIKESNTDV